MPPYPQLRCLPPQSKIFHWKIFFTAFGSPRGEPAVTIGQGWLEKILEENFRLAPAAAFNYRFPVTCSGPAVPREVLHSAGMKHEKNHQVLRGALRRGALIEFGMFDRFSSIKGSARSCPNLQSTKKKFHSLPAQERIGTGFQSTSYPSRTGLAGAVSFSTVTAVP